MNRALQIALEIIWVIMAFVCFYMSYRLMGVLTSRAWIFAGMGVFALFMALLRMRLRRRREAKLRNEKEER
ncbi:MAG: hypothetical protein CSA97_03530 [Bacteroidetes bacterium]|nr:MAG: hypothetical protein CSA97_03530 [Bacteroidota bacterium]